MLTFRDLDLFVDDCWIDLQETRKRFLLQSDDVNGLTFANGWNESKLREAHAKVVLSRFLDSQVQHDLAVAGANLGKLSETTSAMESRCRGGQGEEDGDDLRKFFRIAAYLDRELHEARDVFEKGALDYARWERELAEKDPAERLARAMMYQLKKLEEAEDKLSKMRELSEEIEGKKPLMIEHIKSELR